MIIQCRQCEARYRFDDALIVGEGVWVRCSRCQTVFFQENPAAPAAGAGEEAKRPGADAALRTGTAAGAPPGLSAGGAPAAHDKALARPPAGREERTPFPRGAEVPEDREPLVDRGDLSEDKGAEEDAFLEDAEEADEAEEKAFPPRKKRRGLFSKAVLGLVLFAALCAGILFWLVPDMGLRAVQTLSAQVPGLGEFLGLAVPEQPALQMRLFDLRQRVVVAAAGQTLRVVEGTAINGASYPVRAILVKAELVDGAGVVLAEQAVFGGNSLTDEELTSLPVEDVRRELAQPAGSDVAYDRLPPQGQVPFMVVFFREPAGAVKTLVSIIGAEKAP